MVRGWGNPPTVEDPDEVRALDVVECAHDHVAILHLVRPPRAARRKDARVERARDSGGGGVGGGSGGGGPHRRELRRVASLRPGVGPLVPS